MRRIAAIVALLAMSAFPASGQAPAMADGTVLRKACADFSLYYLYGSCIGYIAGVHDRYVSAPGDGPTICVPADMNAEGRRDVVWAYLEDHPDRFGESAESLVLHALIAAFPCQGN